jgi:hypothetical protein
MPNAEREALRHSPIAVGSACLAIWRRSSNFFQRERPVSAEYCLLTSSLTRLSNKIGLRRLPKAIQSLTLQDYFDSEQPSGDSDHKSGKSGSGSNSASTRDLKHGRELRFGEGGAGREETSGGL